MIIDKGGEQFNIKNLEKIKSENKNYEKNEKMTISLFENELNEYYKNINENHSLPANKIIPSRKAFLKTAINFYKKLLLKMIFPSISLIISIQNYFNSNLVRLLNVLRERVEKSFNEIMNDFKSHIAKTEDSIKEINNKILEYNHYRWTEIKSLEHRFHKDLLDLRNEIGNIAFSFLHLHNLINDYLQRQQQTTNSLSNAISNLKKVMLTMTIDYPFNSENAKIKRERTSRINRYDYIYFNLEETLRGSEEEIASRQSAYLEYLEGKEPIIDIGCGRGEMLELLSKREIKAIGVDSNEIMVNYCKKKGLVVEKADALNFLSKFENQSIGAIFASHFIEHLSSEGLINFLILSSKKLKNNGVIILETPNPLGLYNLSQSFYLDFTHIKPVHPFALKLLLEAIGFKIIKLQYLSPWNKDIQLAEIPSNADGLNRETLETIRNNFRKLNEIIFSYRDYCIIAEK